MNEAGRGWLLKQTWEHLLFLHWEVPADVLEDKIPRELELDTFQGSAWVGIVPFAVNHMRGRGLPEIPFARSYLECNVRTYVTYKGDPGVYFFSLDANHLPVTAGARKFFHLPYYQAEMKMAAEKGSIHFSTRRIQKGTNAESLWIEYTPGAPLPEKKNPLTNWLTERYCLWTVKDGEVYKGEIAHETWKLHEAESVIHEQSLWQAGISNNQNVHLCCAPKQTAFLWPVRRIGQ
ncbi:DUF2071 domain-containing protein [Bacillus salacetis]|uniref:DUF2071 domain-containing protein n=1 Tax=Bacillus salacetis TaxID=2315464 RepID=A0A3A1QX52_9BACI|nr:DUF2071 domain-containing protein [Bacillus salacetis]RIW33235.1 DUF2071 domain-containing protein [Bacillus salacetis]